MAYGILVWTVLISTVANGSDLSKNNAYTKVSTSPYNNDSFEPDGKGRTISDVKTKAAYTANQPKTPTSLGAHSYSSKNVPLYNSPSHIPSAIFNADPHISTSPHSNKIFRFTDSNSIPLTPVQPRVNQISAVMNYAPAEIPVRSSIHSFASALPETKLDPVYSAEPGILIANVLSSANSEQASSTGASNIVNPHNIQTTTTTQYHSQDELGQYTFGYSGGPSSRHETSDVDGTVRGSYSYVDPYGEIQTRHYIADDDGFRVVATNILSNLLRKKRSLINTKLFTAPANTIHSTYPIFYSSPRLHVLAQTNPQTTYLNEPILSKSESIAYISTPVGGLTKSINYKEPTYATGYVPRAKILGHHKEPVSVSDFVPRTKTSSHHRNHEPGYVPPKAKALVHYENYGLYHNSEPNIVDYSKITLFRANR